MGRFAGSPALLTRALCVQKLKDPLIKWDQVTHLSHLPTTIHPATSSSLHVWLPPLSICNTPQYNLLYLFLLLSRGEGHAQRRAPLESQRAGPFELRLNFNSAPFLSPSASL